MIKKINKKNKDQNWIQTLNQMKCCGIKLKNINK
jgi:hypothetical protein